MSPAKTSGEGAVTRSQQTALVIQSITRNAVGLVTVLGIFYLLANRIEIPSYGWVFSFIVLAGLYGAESVLQVLNYKNGGK